MVAKAKPKKPRPNFPLFPHATGRWAKKIRGKLHYFGKVADDPEGVAAESKYLDQRDDLQAGRKPRDTRGGLTVSVGSDAHSVAQLATMRYGVDQLRRAWLTPADVLNARPLAAVKKFLRKGR